LTDQEFSSNDFEREEIVPLSPMRQAVAPLRSEEMKDPSVQTWTAEGEEMVGL
jgi:hypothetical protein